MRTKSMRASQQCFETSVLTIVEGSGRSSIYRIKRLPCQPSCAVLKGNINWTWLDKESVRSVRVRRGDWGNNLFIWSENKVMSCGRLHYIVNIVQTLHYIVNYMILFHHPCFHSKPAICWAHEFSHKCLSFQWTEELTLCVSVTSIHSRVLAHRGVT